MHDFIHSRTSICCFGCFDFSGQMDGQECLSTSPSYLCFLVSNSIHAYITNFEQVIFGPSEWGALGATDPSKADFQNLLSQFRSDQLTQTRSNRKHLDWSRFSSRWNWVVIFGVTEVHNCLAVIHLGATEFFNSVPPTAKGYIYWGQRALITPSNVFAPHPLLPSPWSPDRRRRRLCALAAGLHRRQRTSPPRRCRRRGTPPS